MIRTVNLQNWKRHSSLEHTFVPGLNFILGANGRGKTSLLQGIRFALFGYEPPLAVQFIRNEAQTATARVELDGLSPIAITRTLTLGGELSTTIETQPGKRATQTAEQLIADRFAADASFLATLLFLSEGDIYAYQDGGEAALEQQIERMFPVARIQALRSEADRLRRRIGKYQRVQRASLQLTKEEEAQLQDEQHALEDRISALSGDIVGTRSRLSQLRAADQRRALAAAQQERYAEWATVWRTFVRSLEMGDDFEPLVVMQRLGDRQHELQPQVDDARQTKGNVAGRRASVEALISLLEGKREETCPLCHQPLDSAHRQSALSEQRQALGRLDEEERQVQELIDVVSSDLNTTRVALSEGQRLIAERPSPPDSESLSLESGLPQQVNQEERNLISLEASLQQANQRLGEVRERLVSSTRERAIERQVIAAFRVEALLSATEMGLQEFMRRLRLSILEPIARELERHWKGFMPSAEWSLGLTEEKGTLCIRRGARSLSYAALSGGEKTVALILLHLALARALTQADFLVLDEPLEHLDPRSRRLLVSSLQGAIRSGLFQQILVSTYEEPLVRRFIADSADRVLYLDK
jgi:DNA repair exonuclease SbcCD ATPase subunit